MKNLLAGTSALVAATIFSVAAQAQDAPADGPILFTNVNVFDGVNETLMEDLLDIV